MKLISIFFFIFLIYLIKFYADNEIEFEKWKKQFKKNSLIK